MKPMYSYGPYGQSLKVGLVKRLILFIWELRK